MPFAAGPQRVGELCAAVSDERGRAVLQCAWPDLRLTSAAGPALLAACPLSHDGVTGSVATCRNLASAAFLRQEASGRVLTLSSRLSWFDLHAGYTTETPAERGSRFGDFVLDEVQFGMSPVFFPVSDAHVLLTAEASHAWRYVPHGTRASAELAWLSDGGSTAWADLR